MMALPLAETRVGDPVEAADTTREIPTAQAEPTRHPGSAEDQVPGDWDPATIDHDESLIRWMLSLSPTQRLEVAQGFADSVRILRRGTTAHGDPESIDPVRELSRPEPHRI